MPHKPLSDDIQKAKPEKHQGIDERGSPGDLEATRTSAETGMAAGASPEAANFPSIVGFRFLRVLGQGGMGTVYLAEDATLGRRVALKVVASKYGGAEARARFLREARLMATVEHPHIVRIYSFGEFEGQAYIVMEYVEGENLAARIRRLGALPAVEALRIARQAADALAAAWEKNIVHRDIKPSNILLDRRDQVRVADFGLAKPAQQEMEAALTRAGHLLGTPGYVSPEQAVGQTADFRSDIYSLGIVLHEMLAGEHPFPGATPLELVRKHVHEPLPSLRSRRPEAPESCERLIEWMTRKSPQERSDSYQSLLQAIDDVLAHKRPPPVGPETLAEPAPPKAKWRKAAAWAAAVLLLGAAGWLGWKNVQRLRAPTAGAAKGLVVAVAPLYGPDEDSAKEGRVMAALVEKAVAQRLGKHGARVIGVEEVREAVRDHAAARQLGERLGANVVVWGEAFALRAETEIQPYFTMVPPRPAEGDKADSAERSVLSARDPMAAMQERTAAAVTMQAATPNQIELRKTSAAGVGDVVLFLAGLHALYTEKQPGMALEFFDAVPKTAESLAYRSEALLALKRRAEAVGALRESIALDPRAARSQALLGDLLFEDGKLPEAAGALRAAAQSGGEFMTRNAIFHNGALYGRELVPIRPHTQVSAGSTYLLRLELQTGRVLERYNLPGLPTSFTFSEGNIRTTYEDNRGAFLQFANGKFDRPVFLPASLLARRDSWRVGLIIASNFVASIDALRREGARKLPPTVQKKYPDYPATVAELEAAARQAAARDPTQPWHMFVLGQALWAQDQKSEAEEAWSRIFSGGFPATPYHDFSSMAFYFESLDQRQWADRAYQEALKRRKLHGPVFSLIERLINASFFVLAGSRGAGPNIDVERAFLLLERSRELTGLAPEIDWSLATGWEKLLRQRGRPEMAAREAAVAKAAAQHPLNIVAALSRYDVALYAQASLVLGFLAVAGFTVAGLPWKSVFSLRRASKGSGELSPRTRLPSLVALVSSERRAVIAGALLALMASTLATAAAGWRVEAIVFLPIGGTEEQGHAWVVGHVEDWLKAYNGPHRRFAAAVVNHRAGNTARARELYTSLGSDERAVKNAEALQKGELEPPILLTAEDFYRAAAERSWITWLRQLWRPGARVSEVMGQPFVLVNANSVLLAACCGLGFAALILFWRIPARQGTPADPPAPAGGLARIGFALVPGSYDLRRGCFWRGYLTWLLWALVVVVGVSLIFLREKTDLGRLAPGPYTAWAASDNARFLPSPIVSGDPPRIAAGYRWTFFWAYPYARIFWPCLALAAFVCAGLHIGNLRRIWRAHSPV